jgi:hypothetical protein
MISADTDGYDKIRRVGEDLLGTCQSVDTILSQVFEVEDLTLEEVPIELLHELDEITMECVACNWWFEPCELDDSQVCKDCGGEFDD